MARGEKPVKWRARKKAWLQAPILTIFLKDHKASWKKCVLKSEFSKFLYSPSTEYSVHISWEIWTQLRGKKKQQIGNEIVNQTNIIIIIVCVIS